MQTFLPYPGFRETAAVLDQRRLGKQRVEAIQVLRALTVPGYGWRHHPAAAMWAGYEEALVRYGLDICEIWCATGRIFRPWPTTCPMSGPTRTAHASNWAHRERSVLRRLNADAGRQWRVRRRRLDILLGIAGLLALAAAILPKLVNERPFSMQLAIAALAIGLSVLIHGIAADPIMRWLERRGEHTPR
ncbi:MSMEG_6728 family protein [Amycolatopsis sp. cg5]|uniref:MSMEG_6728 family protein n=1 Tax=Amycolatopsis sp. cg5 TaxID=3238802 RepID=UPI0035245F3F